MATVCQLSYPLNSENASPFGTRTEYLACPVSCAVTALTPKTASTETASETTLITTAGILLLFIPTPLVAYRLPPSHREGLHAARSSSEMRPGCSHAAKRPPLSRLFEPDVRNRR